MENSKIPIYIQKKGGKKKEEDLGKINFFNI